MTGRLAGLTTIVTGASSGIVVTERVPLKATDSSEAQPGWNLTVASSFAPSSACNRRGA